MIEISEPVLTGLRPKNSPDEYQCAIGFGLTARNFRWLEQFKAATPEECTAQAHKYARALAAALNAVLTEHEKEQK